MIYHYTNMARLPWIMNELSLRPSRPHTTKETPLVWGTRDAKGEATAGFVNVRFLLGSLSFDRWNARNAKRLGFSVKARNVIDRTGREAGSDPANWWVCDQPVPIGHVPIQYLRDRDDTWVNLPRSDLSWEFLSDNDDTAKMVLKGNSFYITRFTAPGGENGYTIQLDV